MMLFSFSALTDQMVLSDSYLFGIKLVDYKCRPRTGSVVIHDMLMMLEQWRKNALPVVRRTCDWQPRRNTAKWLEQHLGSTVIGIVIGYFV